MRMRRTQRPKPSAVILNQLHNPSSRSSEPSPCVLKVSAPPSTCVRCLRWRDPAYDGLMHLQELCTSLSTPARDSGS